MNTFLYKRCRLYRAFFKEELLIRERHRDDRLYDYFLRKRRREQLEVARRVFEDEIKSENYGRALEVAAYYITIYQKAYIS